MKQHAIDMRARYRRSSQSGAVFVEALMILVAQTVVFGAVLFVYQLGAEAHNSLQKARAEAFDRAQNRCNQPMGGGAFSSPSAFDSIPQSETTNPDPSMLGPSQEEGASASSKPVTFAGRAFSANYDIRVPCNEGTTESPDQAKSDLNIEDWMSQQVH